MKPLKSVAGSLAAAAAAVFVLTAATSGEAAFNKQETKCSKSLVRSVSKMTSAVVKTTAKCLDGDIKGKKIQSCSPLPERDQGKVAKATAKVYKAASKRCASTCSTAQDVACIGDLFCPPRNATSGRCSGNGKQKFNYTNLGFPGFFCPEPGILDGAAMVSTGDMALCVSSIGSDIADTVIAQTYGSITGAAEISESAADCLKAIGNVVPKTISSIAKAIAKCRDKQNSLSIPTLDPSYCRTADQKTVDSIAKATGKLEGGLDAKCSDDAIAELDICGNGPGGTPDLTSAKSCLGALVQGVVESDDLPDDRSVSRVTLIDAAYPDRQRPTCGDNKVNQLPSPFYLLGEECDGTDDSACPGQCGAPGDVWECTCLDVPRIRQISDGPECDIDNGWTGSSHDSEAADLGGYISAPSDCDCTEIAGATCTGSSSDSTCTLVGKVHPVCSHSPGSDETCDEMGDSGGINTDSDCRVCDDRSVNAGSYCENESDCQSQCLDAETLAAVDPQVLCQRQSDCASGELCLGRCDDSATCIFTPNAAPLGVSAGGAAVCILSWFTTDVTGTLDLVTGEHAVDYVMASFTHLADSTFRPCPVCGGVCGGGARRGAPCEGTCDVSGDPCRFDSDCSAPVDSECTSVSPDCPDNVTTGDEGYCNLSLVCSDGAPGSVGKACRVESETPFGTTSSDCLPDNNISGEAGLTIRRFPSTSEKTSQGVPGPGDACTAAGYENYDCVCPASPRGNGAPSRPNSCRAACDAPGANFGVGCGTGNSNGFFTVCDGGDEDGAACDEDDDCSGGGACSRNPTHCTAGDADKLLDSCTQDGDCGDGGVCSDACPGGRCVPLCVVTGVCLGGDKDGFDCGTNADCVGPVGGGTCGPGPNQYEGVCAAGPPFTHCGGADYGFVVCLASNVGTRNECEYGVDGIAGTNDDLPGAGYCVTDVRDCYLTDPATGEVGAVEGGDTLNGKGDATNYYTVSSYCIPDATAASVNNTSGLGGGGREQAHGVNVANFAHLPRP